MNNVQKTLKEIRKDYNLTQMDACRLLQMPKRTYENWESGERTPSEWMFNLVVDALRRRAEEQKKQEEEMKTLRDEYKGMKKYIMSDERENGSAVEIFPEVYDTLEEANKAAEDTFDRLTESEKAHRNIVVYEVTADDLDEYAFDEDEIDWTAYESADVPDGAFEFYHD